VEVFDIAGSARLALLGAEEDAAAWLRSQMDPYWPAPAARGPAEVVLEAVRSPPSRTYVDVQNPAGDGLVTASDGARFYVLHGGTACSVPDPLHGAEARFSYDAGFPLWRIFRGLVRPALQIAFLRNGAVAVHSASVEVDGGGIVIAGWSESGKTETALAFVESGARFVSDKWTILRPGLTIGAFPIGVGIRRWVLGYLPRLRAELPHRARLQLAAAGLASGLSKPLRALPAPGRVGGLAVDALDRLVALGDRAALRPSEVRAAYGHDATGGWEAPLRAVALLTTSSDARVHAGPADPGWAAQRLAWSAAFERRAYFELEGRLRFAFPGRSIVPLAAAVERERELLEDALAEVPVVDVRAPFPVDPRRVADAIGRAL
jgi:hypothetical protein